MVAHNGCCTLFEHFCRSGVTVKPCTLYAYENAAFRYASCIIGNACDIAVAAAVSIFSGLSRICQQSGKLLSDFFHR